MYPKNYLPKLDTSNVPTGCCPVFNPEDWDEKTFTFEDKLFAKIIIFNFLYVPLNFKRVTQNVFAKIRAAGATAQEDFVILTREASPWYSVCLVAVTKPVTGVDTTRLSGTFMAKVFEGSYRRLADWYQQLIEFVKLKDKVPVRTYFYYTTCPDCARIYGKNYVVGVEQVEDI